MQVLLKRNYLNGLRISQTQKLEPPRKTPSYHSHWQWKSWIKTQKRSISASLTSSWLALYVFLFISVHSFKSLCSTSTSNFCSSERGAASLSKKAGVTHAIESCKAVHCRPVFLFIFIKSGQCVHCFQADNLRSLVSKGILLDKSN